MDSQQRLLDRPLETWDGAIEFLRAAISAEGAGDFDVVVGVNTGSLFLASLLAEKLRLPFAYVRAKPKGHGKQNKAEGRIGVGDRALVVADLPLAAGAIADTVGTVESMGGRTTCCLTVQAEDSLGVGDYCRANQISWIGVSDVPASPSPRPEITPSGPTDPARVPTGALERKRRVARALLDVGAVSISRRNPFTYTSGLISPIYTDCRLLLTSPEHWGVVLDAFSDFIADQVGRANVDALQGTATAGIPHAAILARRLGVPLGYVTFETTTGTSVANVSGPLEANRRVVVIEDLLTTGASVLTSAEVVRNQGATIDWCIAIFTYGSPVVAQNFAEHQIRFDTLCDLATLLGVARERGDIQPDDEAAVHDWLRSPQDWADREKQRLF